MPPPGNIVRCSCTRIIASSLDRFSTYQHKIFITRSRCQNSPNFYLSELCRSVQGNKRLSARARAKSRLESSYGSVLRSLNLLH